jgi:hypothetical protein
VDFLYDVLKDLVGKAFRLIRLFGIDVLADDEDHLLQLDERNRHPVLERKEVVQELFQS